MKPLRSGAAVALAIAIARPVHAPAAEPSAETLPAFDRYVQLTEARMDRGVKDGGPFLWIDALPSARRTAVYAKLRRGEIITAALDIEDGGRSVTVPDALFIHSIAAGFLPAATLERTLAVLQDYDHHADIYGPGVRRSKILQRQGDDFVVYRQLFEKKIVTFVVNAEFRVHYSRPDPKRVDCRSFATRVAEVVDVGRPTEHERRPQAESARQWRFRTYCRLEERDGGTYMEYETLFVGPQLPILVRAFAGPIVRSFPAEVAIDIMKTTRRVLGAHS